MKEEENRKDIIYGSTRDNNHRYLVLINNKVVHNRPMPHGGLANLGHKELGLYKNNTCVSFAFIY